MRRIVTAQAALLGLSLLAFQTDLVAVSRVAVPEVPLMLLELLVYLTLTKFPSRLGAVGAGLLTCLAIGMKLTAAPLTLIATAIILFVPLGSVPFRERFRILLTYWTALAVVPAAGIIVWLVWHDLSAPTMNLLSSARVITGYLRLSGIYGFVSFPFTGGFAGTCNAWALGLWISLLAFMARERTQMTAQERTHLTASALWLGIYVPIMLALDYFPTRYKIHVLRKQSP